MATVGSDRLMGMAEMRLRMRVLTISPLLIGRRKLRKMLTRTSRIAVKVPTLPMGFRKSFQRMPRMENARRKEAPERRARTMPRGVIRFCCSMRKLMAMLTKRETRYNRPMPISRPMIIFVAGARSKPFMTFALLRAGHIDWPG